MMAASLPVVVSRERADGVPLARAQGASVILMDDGFQNPSVAKDVSLIVIDGDRGLGNGRVLPAGPLRAPLRPQLARTDALVIVGQGAAAADDSGRSRRARQAGAAGAPQARRRVGRVASWSTRAGLCRHRRSRPLLRNLRASGIELVGQRAFADHHPFSQGEIEALIAEAKRDALTLVTTEKDFARLRTGGEVPDRARAIVPFAVTLEFEDATLLRKFVTERLFQARDRKFRE